MIYVKFKEREEYVEVDSEPIGFSFTEGITLGIERFGLENNKSAIVLHLIFLKILIFF